MQKGVDLGRRQSWIKFQFGCLVHQSIPCQVRCCQTLCYCTFSKHHSMNQSLSEGMPDSYYVITNGGHCSMPRISPSFGPSPLKPVKVLSIRDGHLRVVNDHFRYGSMGVMHSDAFFVVPREDALLTTQLNNADFCSQTVQSAKSLLQIQKKVGGKSTERGVHCLTFTDNKDGVINYATIGC